MLRGAPARPQVYNTMWDAARGIVRQRGVAGLYSGLGVTLIEIVPYAALQFGIYDALNMACNDLRRRRAREAAAAAAHRAEGAAAPRGPGGAPRAAERGEGEASSSGRGGGGVPELPSSRTQAFVCGLVAGLVAKLVTHPLDVAKKRYQVGGRGRAGPVPWSACARRRLSWPPGRTPPQIAGLQRSLRCGRGGRGCAQAERGLQRGGCLKRCERAAGWPAGAMGLSRGLSRRYGARVQADFAMASLAQSLANIYRTGAAGATAGAGQFRQSAAPPPLTRDAVPPAEGIVGLWKGSMPSIIKVRRGAVASPPVHAWHAPSAGQQRGRAGCPRAPSPASCRTPPRPLPGRALRRHHVHRVRRRPGRAVHLGQRDAR